VVSRDRLIDELWGERPPEAAVQSVQVYVSRLRKLLPRHTLLTRAPGYVLEIEPDELDLRRFERCSARGVRRSARVSRSGRLRSSRPRTAPRMATARRVQSRR